jgi:hypothetical protein
MEREGTPAGRTATTAVSLNPSEPHPSARSTRSLPSIQPLRMSPPNTLDDPLSNPNAISLLRTPLRLDSLLPPPLLRQWNLHPPFSPLPSSFPSHPNTLTSLFSARMRSDTTSSNPQLPPSSLAPQRPRLLIHFTTRRLLPSRR